MLLALKRINKKILSKIKNIVEIPFKFSDTGCETILRNSKTMKHQLMYNNFTKDDF